MTIKDKRIHNAERLGWKRHNEKGDPNAEEWWSPDGKFCLYEDLPELTTRDWLWERLSRLHPTPWYLEQSNLSGVEVKDNRGSTVYYEDLGCIPDEMPSGQAAAIREAADTLGRFLVELSQT